MDFPDCLPILLSNEQIRFYFIFFTFFRFWFRAVD